ncbi:MAG: redoxin domain-containing protein [Polyangiales bacterium]
MRGEMMLLRLPCLRPFFGAMVLALGVGCVRPSTAAPPTADVSLIAADGHRLETRELWSGADWTVLVFISRDCPCVAAHDARLRELAATFASRGVRFFAIDSELGGTPEIAAAEARTRQYPFPIVVDAGAHLADQLGAEYATHTVIMNRAGQVLYRGGIDSDKQSLHADATMYLRDALTDLIAGKVPRVSESTALGCSLRKWAQ